MREAETLRAREEHNPYQRIASRCEILLVDQDRPGIELWSRQSGGAWVYSSQTRLEAMIEIPRFRRSLALQDVYEGVSFD